MKWLKQAFKQNEGSPKRYAFVLALGYFVVSILWITCSTHLARQWAADLAQMEVFEIYKGYAFICLTSILIFGVSYLLFRRVAHQGTRYLRAQQKLANSERHVFAGMIASSVAHDFNNILMILRVSADRLLQEPHLTASGVINARRIDDNLGRLADLSQRLRNVSQMRVRSTAASFDLVHTVKEAIGLVSLHERLERCTVKFDAHPPVIQMVGFPILIHQMVMNLMLNAAEATEGRGTIEVKLLEDERRTLLTVEDNGPGIAEEMRSKIFEAFYTTKVSGSGLGLVSVRDCVDAHRADIDVTKGVLGGAKFEISIPHADLSESDKSDS